MVQGLKNEKLDLAREVKKSIVSSAVLQQRKNGEDVKSDNCFHCAIAGWCVCMCACCNAFGASVLKV